MAEVYSGTVASLVYENEDFHIIRLILDEDKGQLTTVKGHFPAQNISIGTWVSFEGKWQNHAQYGKQLTVTRSPVAVQKWTNDRVLSALSSQGVGPSVRMGLQIYATFRGLALADLLDAGDLEGVEGLDEFGKLHTLTRWKALRTYLDGASFMADAGLPASVVNKVWQIFGSDLENVITSDPWILVRVAGVGFQAADEIAVRLGVSLDNPGRVRGAVLAAVQETVLEGHVFASTGQVVHQVNRMIPGPSVDAQSVASAIRELVEKKSLVADRVTSPGVVALYDSWHHRTEVFCAERLIQRMSTSLNEEGLRNAYAHVGDLVRDARDEGADLDTLARKALESWALGRRSPLTIDQTQAAVWALTSPVSLLTGLPGTGKTTTLQAVVSILQDSGIPFLLAAPTGIAAKRMSFVTGAEASTIHRAFGAKGFMKDAQEREASYVGVTGQSVKKTGSDKDGEDWGYGPGNPHPAQVVVVDESSMLDLHMLFRLLSGTSDECRIVFVGDPYQLPSVGAGDVLRDLVRSKVFAHSHLSQIFRQEGTSGIVLAAHAIHAGKTPGSDGKDFVLVQAGDEESAADRVVQIARKLYEKRANFQVLSPRHAGGAGVTALNQRLRLALNPSVSGLSEMSVGGSVVREGDRIMVVKNDYERGVYNGDVGKVARIDRRSKEIEVKIWEGEGLPPRLVRYPFKDASRTLRLAYCQTVHKSQGQEYDIIVLPLLPSFGRQLQRNLLYTGITRAKQKVFLVGKVSALESAVQNNKAAGRNTLLAERVCSLFGGEQVA